MFFGVILAVVSGALWAATGVICSRIEKGRKNYMAFMAWGSLMASVAAWIFFPDYSEIAAGNVPRFWTMAGIIAVAGASVSIAMYPLFAAMRRGHHGITWTISQSSLAIPFVLGIFIWRDAASIFQYVGVCLILVMLVVAGVASKEEEHARGGWLWFVLALASFLLLGAEQTLKIIPSRWSGWEDVGLRPPVGITAGMIVYMIVAIARKNLWQNVPWRETILCTAIGLPSYYTIYLAADFFADEGVACITYPLSLATSTVMFALYSAFFLKEPLTKPRLIAVVAGIAGIALVSFSTNG